MINAKLVTIEDFETFSKILAGVRLDVDKIRISEMQICRTLDRILKVEEKESAEATNITQTDGR